MSRTDLENIEDVYNRRHGEPDELERVGKLPECPDCGMPMLPVDPETGPAWHCPGCGRGEARTTDKEPPK